MDDHAYTKDLQPTVENLSKAVYTVNRHAKTAPNPKYLYLLKKRALQKLVKEGKGKKIGLHFSKIQGSANSNRTCLSQSETTIFTCLQLKKTSNIFRI